MTNRNRVRLSKLSLGLALALAAAPAFAQNTSAGLGGTVSGADGQPVAGASVTIVHAESGTASNVTTDADGRYSARGLRPGGPYTITITKDGVTEKRENVFIQLGQVTSVDATVGSSSAVTLDTVQVTGANLGVSDAFSTDNMGSGTNVTEFQLQQQPTIDRSIADVIKLDPRIVKLDRETQQVTVSGQNPRFNNIKIDGVPTNDNFGLNDSGLPALNQPISGDWISQYNIGISGYDVSQADFVGANINAVTKSGTNELRGTVYYIFRDNDWIRESENGSKFAGLTEEWTRGAYVGAPIIKDRLFIFAGYEQFQRSNTLPPRGVAGSDATTNLFVTQAQVDEIDASFDRLFPNAGVEPGTAPAPFDNTDDKKFLKLDWNISDSHRASLRYNETDGSVARFSRTTGQLQLASNVYADNISFKSLALNLYDDWTENLSSEFHVSQADYDSAPSSSVRMPQITIRNIPGASGNTVVFGTERSRHANLLGVDTLTSALMFNYFMGDHELKFGADYEKSDVYNLFLQDVFGNYTIDYCQFTNTPCPGGVAPPNNTAATLPWASYNFQRPTAGSSLDDVAAQFSVATLGLMLQDTWTATNNLTLTYGLRVDTSDVGGRPKENARFHSDFGVDNRNTIDGNQTVQPRFGFNYTFPTDHRMQLRGGIGRFLGSAPGVWVSNSFSNPGVGVDSFNVGSGGTGVTVDPDNPLVPTTGGVASRQVNALSDDFKQPTVQKANLAFETELGVMDMVGGIEVLLTEVEKGVHFTNVAIGAPNGTLPDGREFYWLTDAQSGFNQGTGSTTGSNRNQANCIPVNPADPFNRNTNPCAYTNAIVLSNTDRGHAQNLTVFLEKPWKNNWSAKVGYTYGRAEEVSPATSSVAFSNWNGRFAYNPNEERLGRANYEIRDRFTASASYRWNWFGERAPTTLSMFYEGRSGRPFSYAFANDANGDGQSNDLFYIPASQSDVAYTTFNGTSGSSPQDIERFWLYMLNNKYLSSHLGQVARRNGARAPFVNQVDLRLSQKFPLIRGRESEVFLDIQNFGNLLNKKWGQIEEAGFPSRVQMARFAGVNGSGQYVYDVSQFFNEANGQATTPTLELRDVAAESRWSAQVGVKINF